MVDCLRPFLKIACLQLPIQVFKECIDRLGFSFFMCSRGGYEIHFGMRKRKNRIYSKQVLHLTSTPLLRKIRSAGILSIWQKETTSSHI